MKEHHELSRGKYEHMSNPKEKCDVSSRRTRSLMVQALRSYDTALLQLKPEYFAVQKVSFGKGTRGGFSALELMMCHREVRDNVYSLYNKIMYIK